MPSRRHRATPPIGRPARSLLAWTLLAAVVLGVAGCDRAARGTPSAVARTPPPPNVLWIIWDTVRHDRMSVYGSGASTTPHVAAWADAARVYENCVSVGSTTVPSHASLFTGLLPSEHGAHNMQPVLDESFDTIAELAKRNGYATYLFSENPYISADGKFDQGFDLSEHPWDQRYREQALRITQGKIPDEQRRRQLQASFQRGTLPIRRIKAAGELAQQGVESWLATLTTGRPFFIVLNYMEAHHPLLPPRKYRERFMTPEQVQRSYEGELSWEAAWSYAVGLADLSDEQLELIRLTYDAALAELDDLFGGLLASLEKSGRLQDTIVILCSDHGEHLGEHHLLDHQYSVYEELLRVPLIVHYPARVPSGRESRPVTNMDLFPTLLELMNLPAPTGWRSQAVSLLSPRERRVRLGEYPAAMMSQLRELKRMNPGFDPTRWTRALRAYYDEPYKFIWGSDGAHELYRLDSDPQEQNNLLAAEPQVAKRMDEALDAYLRSLQTTSRPRSPLPKMSREQRQRLSDLGYVGAGSDDDESAAVGDAPATQPAKVEKPAEERAASRPAKAKKPRAGPP